MAAKMREETKVSARALQAAFVQLQLPGRCCTPCVQIRTAVSFGSWPAGNNVHAVVIGEKNEQKEEKIIIDTNKNAKITQPPTLLLK